MSINKKTFKQLHENFYKWTKFQFFDIGRYKQLKNMFSDRMKLILPLLLLAMFVIIVINPTMATPLGRDPHNWTLLAII